MLRRYQTVSIEKYDIPVRGLSPDLNGLRISQLSDFHYDGDGLSDALLRDAIAASNALNPDIVVLTGDYVTDSPDPIYRLVPHLEKLKSRYGIHAVLGNHDNIYQHSRSTITHAMTLANIKVMWDEVTFLEKDALAVVGLSDFWGTHFNPDPVMQPIPLDMPRLVLSHNPDSAKPLMRHRVDLQLSGHTHGGQVVLPGLGPVVKGFRRIRKCAANPLRHQWSKLTQNCDKIVRYWEWAEGLHRVGENMLYVNRGLGTHWPGRLFCPPEVSLLTLRAI